eukprot:362945-Chlamydomonas_euryale.AAC.2
MATFNTEIHRGKSYQRDVPHVSSECPLPAHIAHFDAWRRLGFAGQTIRHPNLRDRVWDPERDQWDIPHGASRVPQAAMRDIPRPASAWDSVPRTAHAARGTVSLSTRRPLRDVQRPAPPMQPAGSQVS